MSAKSCIWSNVASATRRLPFIPNANSLLLSSSNEIQELAINRPLSWLDEGATVNFRPTISTSRSGIQQWCNAIMIPLSAEIVSNPCGYLHLKKHHSGMVSSVGKLPDGTSITHSGYLHHSGSLSYHQTAYNYTGSLQGALYFPTEENPNVESSLSWRRHDPANLELPRFFQSEMTAITSQVPSPGNFNRMLGTIGTNSIWNMSGDAWLMPYRLSLSSKGKWSVLSPFAAKPISRTFKTDAKTGAFSGSYLQGGTGKKVVFGGIFSDPESNADILEGYGHILRPDLDDQGKPILMLERLTLKPHSEN